MLNKQQDHLPLHACLVCGGIIDHFILSVTLKGKGVPVFQGPMFSLGGQAGDEQKKNLRNCYSEHDFLCFAS